MSQKKHPEKIICPGCGVMVSAAKFHKHVSRGRCWQQHIRHP